MKSLLGGLGVVGVIGCVCLAVGAIGLTVYGLYLAFSASILLGVAAFFVEPSPLLFGAVMFFFGKNLPEAIVKWIQSL